MSQWSRTSLRVNVAHLPFLPVGTVGSCQQERLSEKARWIAKSQNSISYIGKKCWHRFVEIGHSWNVAENYSKGDTQMWRILEKGLSWMNINWNKSYWGKPGLTRTKREARVIPHLRNIMVILGSIPHKLNTLNSPHTWIFSYSPYREEFRY